MERLKAFLKSEDWSHLTEEQQLKLVNLITRHNNAFVLDKNELGTIRAPLAKIDVADPSPVRGPTYWYPEKAKDIITKLLRDMEARDITEPSTTAWLSLIVLVTKPDWSK